MQCLLVAIVRQAVQRIKRSLRFTGGNVPCCSQGVGFFHNGHDACHVLKAACFDRQFDGRALVNIPALHGNDQRQRRFAFPQIVAQIFSHDLRITVVIQHVVNHLKGGA